MSRTYKAQKAETPQPRSTHAKATFETFFTEANIIQELCRERAKLAKRRSDFEFLHKISRNSPNSPKLSPEDLEMRALFPPRKRWHAYRPKLRGKASGYDLNARTLFRTVMKLKDLPSSASWGSNLKARAKVIRERALQEAEFSFLPPKIRPIEKEKGNHKYRPLATFPLDDRIIDRLTARYFRRLLDHALRSSCMAFRCGRKSEEPPTIHEALNRLLRVNRRHRKTGLFVAECDIKSFFDCVSHAGARAAILELARDARRTRPNLLIHPRALQIFDAYLRAYSFKRNVRDRQGYLLGSIDDQGEFKWPTNDLNALYGQAEPDGIGVPQGGALSCLIANAVLHAADKELDRLKRCSRKSFTYLRYCDDMILLARDESVCSVAFKRYQRVLKEKLLPVHPPESVERYDRDFWQSKSKAPYLWSEPKDEAVVPWIQFVGYQIRHDGLVRIRPSSVRKEREKITDVANRLLEALNPGLRRKGVIPDFASGLRKSNGQILHRLRQRLISMTVGRIRLGHGKGAPMPMCWANGFRGLRGKKFIPSALKALDRHRERQIARVTRRLKLRESKPAQKMEAQEVLPFYGKPFSLWGQFDPSA